MIEEHLVQEDGMLEIPIDPIALATEIGLKVQYSTTLGHGVSGVIVKRPDDDMPKIFLNANDPPSRQRFTCAHELGHYMSRKYEGDDKFGYVDERAQLSSTGNDPEERWSNKFAAELMMPAFAVRKFYSDGWNTARLAREFGVSEQAMGYRLQNLYLA